MVAPKTHKFDDKLDITYGQYIMDSMEGEVALQRELEQVLGKKKTYKILRNWAEKRTVKLIKEHLEKSGVVITDLEDFVNYMDKMWSSASSQRTNTCEKIKMDTGSVTYKVTECIWAEKMKELGASDLGQLTMCDIDFLTASAYHPKIKLIREKTIMNGDDCCDFTYVWKD